MVIEKGKTVLQGIRETYPRGKGVYPTVPRGAEDDFIVSELRPKGDKEPVEEFLFV